MQEVLAMPGAVPNFAWKEQQPPRKKKKKEHKEGKTAEQLKNEEKVRKNKAQLKKMCEVFTTSEQLKKRTHSLKGSETYVQDHQEVLVTAVRWVFISQSTKNISILKA